MTLEGSGYSKTIPAAQAKSSDAAVARMEGNARRAPAVNPLLCTSLDGPLVGRTRKR